MSASSSRAMENKHNPSEEITMKPVFWLAAVLLLAGVPFLVYSNSLQSPFVGDDIDFIERNQDVLKFSVPEGLGRLRPLNKFSYWLNLQLHGNAMPGFHLVNIALHAGAGILLFFLLAVLLQSYGPQGAKTNRRIAVALAFAGALLFEVHPVHTQAVNYTFARSELFCAVFLFAALLLHAHRGKKPYGYGRGVSVAVLFLMALACKERAFMFLPALLLFDMLQRQDEAWAQRKRRWLKLAVPMSLVTMLGLINFYIGFQVQHTGAIGSGQEVPAFLPYFLTEMVVRLHYLKLYFWPAGFTFDYTFTLRSHLVDPALLAAIGGHMVLLGLAIVLRRREARCTFGIFWFFLFVLPTAGMVPAALLMHEHWIYISSFGVFLVVTVLVQRLLAASATRSLPGALQRAVFPCLLLLSIVLGVLSFERNKVWQSPIALWQDASRYAPDRQWVWNNLGREFVQAERFQEARTALEKAEELGEPTAALHLNMGICLMEEGDLDGAMTHLKLARKMVPDRPEVLVALARLHARMGKHFMALDMYIAAWQMGLCSPELIMERAKVELFLKHPNRARKVLDEGRKLFPNNEGIQEMLRSLQE